MCEPGREFAFGVGAGKRFVNTWRYQLEPSGDGTDVTESFQLADNIGPVLYWKLLGWRAAAPTATACARRSSA